jgi:two-component sensor histidine kinase
MSRKIQETSAMFPASVSSKAQEGLLLREITHRVNNEFASIIQVVSRTAARSPDQNVKLALAGVAQQLHCYARVHHALQMPESGGLVDASEYLRNLCESISQSKLEHRQIELILADQPFWLSSERCWLMGMAVAELITNAARHAFGESGGTIRIECQVSEKTVECRVADDGSATNVDVRPGTGLRIVEGLAQALGAQFRFHPGESGSTATLAFPIAQLPCVEAASKPFD